jgi:RimJ/RimL family protein N-acetyltransferase
MDNQWQPSFLENTLLKLLPLQASDFDQLFEVASDPLIWEQHPSSDRYKKEVFQEYFQGALEGNMAFIIVDKAKNQIIGSTRFYDYQPENSSIAIGYTFLARAYWGGLYNQSCKKMMLDYAFQTVEKVHFHIGSGNLRSQKAILKMNAQKVAEFTTENLGKKYITFDYVILKNDWLKD